MSSLARDSLRFCHIFVTVPLEIIADSGSPGILSGSMAFLYSILFSETHHAQVYPIHAHMFKENMGERGLCKFMHLGSEAWPSLNIWAVLHLHICSSSVTLHIILQGDQSATVGSFSSQFPQVHRGVFPSGTGNQWTVFRRELLDKVMSGRVNRRAWRKFEKPAPKDPSSITMGSTSDTHWHQWHWGQT